MPGELILAALREAWTTLTPLNVPMAVMGGISVSAWGYLRNTQDVDLLIGVERGDFQAVVNQILDGAFRPKRQPPLFQIDQQDIAQFYYARRRSFTKFRWICCS